MSIQSAKDFVQRLIDDGSFRQRVRDTSTPEERRRIAELEGFDFTSEEIEGAKVGVTDEELNNLLSVERRGGYDSPLGHGGVSS